MQSPYLSSQPAWLTNLLNGTRRPPFGLADPRELASSEDALLGASTSKMGYPSTRSGSEALVLRISDEAARKRPPMGLYDPTEFQPAAASNTSFAGASRAMFNTPGASAPSAPNSTETFVQRILDDAVSKQPQMGLFEANKFGRPEALNSPTLQGISP